MKKDGYFLSMMMESTGNPCEESLGSGIRFPTVTDLIDLYKVTSDKGSINS